MNLEGPPRLKISEADSVWRNWLLNLYNKISGNLVIDNPAAPASATATGVTGTIQWDADYIYVCTDTDTWKRVAISTW